MDPTPISCIDHFTHQHPLLPTAAYYNQQFRCNGCRTIGNGKRFHCNACDFDLHGYCAICPGSLSSFLHPHPLTFLQRNPASPKSASLVCDLCRGKVEGLFYRCEDCDFNVHPICTQLPERINHVLDKIHPLILQSLPADGHCAVCRRICGGWRYACRDCRVEIHQHCVLEPLVGRQQCDLSSTGQRGIPMYSQNMGNSTGQQGIPMFSHNMGSPIHAPPLTFYGYGPGFNMYHGGPYPYPYGNIWPHNLHAGASSSSSSNNVGNSMFGLVVKLGMGVMSNMVFGVDITGLFTD